MDHRNPFFCPSKHPQSIIWGPQTKGYQDSLDLCFFARADYVVPYKIRLHWHKSFLLISFPCTLIFRYSLSRYWSSRAIFMRISLLSISLLSANGAFWNWSNYLICGSWDTFIAYITHYTIKSNQRRYDTILFTFSCVLLPNRAKLICLCDSYYNLLYLCHPCPVKDFVSVSFYKF